MFNAAQQDHANSNTGARSPVAGAVSLEPALAAAIASTTTWVEVVETAADLGRYLDQWQSLADHALEPNVFYEPWQLRPALAAFGTEDRSVFVFVMHRALGSDADPIPIGFFPWQRRSSFRGWPVHLLSAWQHPMALLSTPLLHPGFAHEAWSAMLAWAGTRSNAVTLFELPLLSTDGPAYQALANVLSERGCRSYQAESYHRALLVCDGTDGIGYQQRVINSGVRKELRRQRKRLAELGRLELRVLDDGGDITGWIEQFEALEHDGWKGAEATSLRSVEGHARYFKACCTEAFARQRLHMLALFLDGRPIAMKCNFLAADGAFTLKIAFDERYAKYSPGTLLELDTIVDLHTRPRIRWMDSCAMPDHPMIDRLWGERRAIADVVIAPGGWRGAFLMALFPRLRAVKRRLHLK